jgi:hypothetical protein
VVKEPNRIAITRQSAYDTKSTIRIAPVADRANVYDRG